MRVCYFCGLLPEPWEIPLGSFPENLNLITCCHPFRILVSGFKHLHRVVLPWQAARVLAQVLIAGGTVFLRAATQAWQQALVSELQRGRGGGGHRLCKVLPSWC